MRVHELSEIMETAHVDAAWYGIDEDVPGGLCIRTNGSRWDVYVSADGSRAEERAFDSENDACVYFLLRALELYVRDGDDCDDRG